MGNIIATAALLVSSLAGAHYNSELNILQLWTLQSVANDVTSWIFCIQQNSLGRLGITICDMEQSISLFQ